MLKLEVFNLKDFSPSPGHNFCRRCLRGALQYSMKCPKCREPLPHGKYGCGNSQHETVILEVVKIDEISGLAQFLALQTKSDTSLYLTGFPLNINTVLWNTIQLLFPKVCSMPSSPSSQCAPAHSGRDAGEQYNFAYEAESETLQMERER